MVVGQLANVTINVDCYANIVNAEIINKRPSSRRTPKCRHDIEEEGNATLQ